MNRQIFLLITLFSFGLTGIVSCSLQQKIGKEATATILQSKALVTAHVGITIYEPATRKYWYDYQGDKYFVPASNTKLPTCYAAMKYLGDSLPGLRFDTSDRSCIYIQGTGDPTFLHPDFVNQPVLRFLQSQKKSFCLSELSYSEPELGSGWSWNDYDQYYMAPRSPMPIYGNVVRFKKGAPENNGVDSVPGFAIQISPQRFTAQLVRANIGWKNAKGFSVSRVMNDNSFIISPAAKGDYQEVPFTFTRTLIYSLLADTLHAAVLPYGTFRHKLPGLIHSQPTDSLLRSMMHRSDNFFAEQSLLMVSNERLGVMNDERIIDTLLKVDFRDLPQKPRWVDGSGLSRYNLFSPKDFVAILEMMKNDFGMDRIKHILATGGEGTISNYYKSDSGYIYGKTGTLSGVVAFSGFLYTRKGRLLIFSTLVNNHQSSATEVRRSVEKFLQDIRNQY